MKIAFVNDFALQIGVQYISSVLKQAGHEVRLFMDPLLFADDVIAIESLNRLFDYKKILVKQLKDYQPDIIGFSVVSDFYQWACGMARLIKIEMDVPIIFGGMHPSSVPERVIKNEFVDIVCVGEGEYPMLELVESMAKGKIDYSIKNLWFKKGEKIIRNEVRPLLEDLDSLPMPDKEIFYSESPHYIRRYPYLIVTTRGCPYRCSYCGHSCLGPIYEGKGRYLRQRSVENVIKELSESKNKYKIKHIVFMDDCFGHDRQWLKEFSLQYKEKINLKFICVMHPSDISEETVRYLKTAGCRAIFLGIQSWNERIREQLLGRKISNRVLREAIQKVQKAKIEILVDNIFDLPGQTEDDITQAALIYSGLKPTRIYYYMLRYYPNTAITKQARDEGWISARRYAEIMDGVDVKSFALEGDRTDKNSIRFNILFSLIDLIPAKISRYIIKRKLYRYFPSFVSPAVILILRNIVSWDLNARLLREGAFYRYIYFIKKKIFYLIGNAKEI